MANVTSYSILVYGGPNGYQTNRTQIQLKDGNTVVAWVRFNDPGMAFEPDAMSGSIILMYLPSSMFQSVLDILRNENPLSIYFNAGHALLSTSNEPVGEGE
ncbi:MAG: hypothetical protein ABIQ88_00835 [Chitinophagaceae bacterium]